MWQLVSMRNNLYSIYANNRRIYLLWFFYTMNTLFSISLHSFFKNFSNSQTDVLKYLDMSTRIFIRVPAVDDAEWLDSVVVNPL